MTKEGTVLDGKYEILKEVGRGGMSIVYLAMDKRLNKQWAVKEMKNDGTKSTDTLLKGLMREANILKNVDHPVLPRIVDIIESPNKSGKNTIYVVMDYIEGQNLLSVLKEQGAQPQDTVVEWGRQLADALSYLHSMNPPIIYRDMKPANIMLNDRGDVKLIDFGTAKEYKAENIADTTALGTRGYAAPEQFGDSSGRGKHNTDARTDIYSLGATMYHMVTGYSPTEAPYYEMRPIREINPALSSGLEQIILKCTQNDPKDRYQNCLDLIYDLDHYTELDDSFIKDNKKKFYMFAGALGLAAVFGITAAIGHSGISRLNAENYANLVESGNEAKASNDYRGAANYYKSAFELDGKDSEAYVRFIDDYVDASNDVNEEGSAPLELQDGLTVIANRIKNGYAGVDKNDAVLYHMGLIYFTELEDYQTANKYFNMVDSDDADYGQLAGYYRDISSILSSTNISVDSLMASVDGFASYNSSRFNNTDEEKFVNYSTLGKIYTTYINNEGIAEKAEDVMSRALTDLEEYEGENEMTYSLSFNDALSTIYEKLGDETGETTYYETAITYSRTVVDQVSGLISVGSESENDNVNSLNQKYVNKMCKIASLEGKLGRFNDAVDAYKEAEAELGKKSQYSAKVYAEHLNYLYETYETKNQDPAKWTPANVATILELYEEGLEVSGIDSNTTWVKRAATMEKLRSGNYRSEEETQTEAAGETGDGSSETEGE